MTQLLTVLGIFIVIVLNIYEIIYDIFNKTLDSSYAKRIGYHHLDSDSINIYNIDVLSNNIQVYNITFIIIINIIII